MIIPRIRGSRFSNDEAGQRELIDQLEHWSLFGTAALGDVESFSNPWLEFVVRRVGGLVDLQIELANPTEDVALKLLNAGATTIICRRDQLHAMPSIPADRITNLDEAGSGTANNNRTVDSEELSQQPELIANFFKETLVSDRPDGLWPTLIVDSLGLALGLAYSNYDSLLDAVTHRRGTYWSRSRNELWVKGKTSGATQALLGVRLDCDNDCLRFQVTQDAPGFCHKKTHACFGAERTIVSVIQRLKERIESSDEKSFTKKLINDPEMLRAKLIEEAEELLAADTSDEIAWEAADVLYFSLVKMLSQGVKLEQVYQELSRRMNRVVRRPPGVKKS